MGKVAKKVEVKTEESASENERPETRDEMVAFLEPRGHEGVERYSKPELRQLVDDILSGNVPKNRSVRMDPMTGISRYPKRDLVEIALNLGVPQQEVSSMTNPRLMLRIRGEVEPIIDAPLNFGKHRDKTFRQVCMIQAYMSWAMKEKLEDAHPSFRKLVTIYKMMHRHYPTPTPEAPPVQKEKEGKKPHVWPREPEEESTIPTAPAGSKPSTKFHKIHSEVEEEDSGEISDSPPAWQEKKTKGSEARSSNPAPWPRPANPQQKRK